ncbi:MAG: type II toxin-antitoxin system VapC family toxin [Actinomycetota bacterium]|nr:type II toxin-antitoxin system VapC family toxin [Actinomycetota bacterium]
MTVVLDSWAILRYLEDAEPTASTVAKLLEQERPVVNWINLGEVFDVVCRLHGDDAAGQTIRDLRDAADAELPAETRIIEAARIKAKHALAYADAFGAATTIAHDAVLWTGDPELLVDGARWRWRDLRS